MARPRAQDASYRDYSPNSNAAKGRMKRRIQIIAGTCLLFSLAVCLQCSWAVAQTKEPVSSKQQKLSLDRPAEAKFIFGKNDKYSAVLLCCWHILVYEQRGDRQVIIWDWDKFDGAVGQKDDLLVRDVDEDGDEELIFQISKLNMCLTENTAVLYSPEKRTVFLLKYDGDTSLRLSPNLKDNQKIKECLVKYWQERRRVDLNKISVTYDAEP